MGLFRELLDRGLSGVRIVTSDAHPWLKTLLHSVYDHPSTEGVHAQFDGVVEAFEAQLPKVADHLGRVREEFLAFTAFPRTIWCKIRSNNPNERLNKEIRRRTDVVGIIPDRDSIMRLVGGVPGEQHDEWPEGRRYIDLDALAAAKQVGTSEATAPAETTEEVESRNVDPLAA